MIMLNETDYNEADVTGSAALPTSSSLPCESGFIGGHLEYNGPPSCTGCSQAILDQFILKVQGRLWHGSCLRCAACHVALTRDCFLRGTQVFCQDDFFRLFGARCTGCNQPIPPTDQVQRAHEKIYHPGCFKCIGCDVELKTGDEFYLRDDGKLICRHDYDAAKEREDSDDSSPEPSPKRIRMFISDDQKIALEAEFSQHTIPQTKAIEHLSEETGLNIRTIETWFENKRQGQSSADTASIWLSDDEITTSCSTQFPLQPNQNGTFPVPIVNKEFSGNFAPREEVSNRLGREKPVNNNTLSHWSMSDDMWSADFVPPNIELTPEDIKDGEVCSERNMRRCTERNVPHVPSVDLSQNNKNLNQNNNNSASFSETQSNSLSTNYNWVECPN